MAVEDTPEAKVPDANKPGYWLIVCNGIEAMVAVLGLSSSEKFEELFEKYPVLILPEFPLILEAMASGTDDSQIRRKWSGRSELLKKAHELFRQDVPEFYAFLLGKCGSALTEERRGDPRINLRRAVELFGEARSLLPEEDPNFVTVLKNEGVARTSLAELGVAPRQNLEEALRL